MKPNTNIVKSTTVLLCASILATASTQAAVLAQYNFDPSGSATSSHPGDPLFTTTDLAKGSFDGVTPTQRGQAFIDTNLRVGTSATASATLLGAIDNNTYYGFTLNLGPTASVNLTNLTFNERFAANEAGAGSRGFAILYSTDAFATYTTLFTDSGPNLNNEPNFTSQDVDLSAVPRNLTQNVEFRFYFYDNSTSDARAYRIDDIVLNGEASLIPEPSSAVLLGALGGILLMGRRRG